MTVRSIPLTVLLVAGLSLSAFAHGGAYQPPAPFGRGGRGTGSGGGTGPTTPGGAVGKGPSTGTGSLAGGRGVPGPDKNSWTNWWYPNRRQLLDIRARATENVATTPAARAAPEDPMWRSRVEQALLTALQDNDPDIASGAAVALGKSGEGVHAQALTQVLLDEKRRQEVREAAAVGLGLLPRLDDAVSKSARRALEAVVKNEKDEPPRLRAISLYALGLRREIGSVPLLLDTARRDAQHWEVPAAACSALGMTQVEMVRPDLEAMLVGPRTRRGKRVPVEQLMRQAYSAHGLAKLGGTDSVALLREVAQHHDRHVRASAVMTLGAVADTFDDDTAKLLIRILHKDKERGVQHAAATALGQMGHRDAADALTYVFDKGQTKERVFAALGLGLLARRRGEPRLTDVLLKPLEKSGNAQLRGPLCIALALAGNVRALPAIREICADRGNPEARQHAAFALGLLPDRVEGPAILRELLATRASPALQREASLALGMLGDRGSLVRLRELVEDGSSVFVQGSAAVALGRIGSGESAASLIALLEDENAPGLSRGMATVGLGFLVDSQESFKVTQVAADLNWFMINGTVAEILTIL